MTPTTTNPLDALASQYRAGPMNKVLHDRGRLHPKLALEHRSLSVVNDADLKTLASHGEQTDLDPQSRMTWLTIATEDRDRAGDVMVIAGCDATNFLRNPQFLWHHGLAGLPVHTLGHIVKLVAAGSALYALAEYAPEGTYAFADQIYRLDKAGLLPANSIGFHPIEWEDLDGGGHRFTKWELIECSKVELPMNPHAIDEGKSLSSVDPDQYELDFGRAQDWIATGILPRR